MENHSSVYNFAKIQSNLEMRNIYLDSYPSHVHFLMIDKCNVKCIMCGGDYFRSKSGKMITLEKFKTIAVNLKLENAHAIVLAGAGDPLLNRDLVPIIQFVKEAYPHIIITVTTNGLGLTGNLSTALVASGVNLVNISINAATRASYKRIMQIDGFEAVCANAKTFIERKSRSAKPIILQFSAALNRLNIEDLPRVVELGKEIGVDSINLFYTRFYPERIRHLNVDNPADRLENEASLFFHQRLSDEMVMKAKQLAQRYGIGFTHEPLFRENAPASPCTWPMTQLMVGFDGEIYPCGGAEIHFKEKVEKKIYDFGNALKNPIDAFWNSEIYRALRISSKQGQMCLLPECRCCANAIRPNDVRAHIMQWDITEPRDGHQLEMWPLHPRSESVIAGLPLVSVIVPTYNRPNQLVEAVKSVLGQTYSNLEIIVVNDGGTDVENVVSSLNEGKSIIYVNHGRNRGLAAARNTGIKLAKGKYVAYLDDDDVFYPEHLEILVKFLISGKYKVAYTDAHRAHHKMVDGKYLLEKKDVPYSYDYDSERILRENYIPVLCIMHKKSCLDRVGTFDETLPSHEDWDLWMRMSREYKFVHIPKVTCAFSWREDGSTMTSGQKQNMQLSHAIVSRRGTELQTKRVSPTDGCDQREGAGIQLDKIQSLIAAQKWEEAISEIEGLLAVYPDNAVAHNDLAVLASQKGDWEKAFRHYKRAVELDPMNLIFKKNLGEFYFVIRKDFKNAVQLLLEVLKAQPTDIETLVLLGTMCLQSNREKDAEVFFHQAAELDPTNEEVCNLLLKVRDKNGSAVNPVHSEVEFRSKNTHDVVNGNFNNERENGDLEFSQSYTLSAGSRKMEKDTERSDKSRAQTISKIDLLAMGGSEGEKRIQTTCSIIIPLFNKVEFTRKCIETIRENTKPELYELLLVDNGSTDGTKEYLKSLEGSIKVISNKANRGFAIACNQGANLATKELLLFLNNDVEPCSGWLEPLMKTMEGDPGVAAVGSKLLFPEGTIQHAGVVIINDKRIMDPLVARHVYYRQPSDLAEANQIRTYQALTGACLMIRKTAFEDVQGFDEGFWNGYEDVDLCFKLQEKGWSLVYNPESVLIHHESISGPERFSKIPENISLLHQKWLGKIKPDLVVQENVEVQKTKTERIKAYQVPKGHSQAEIFATTKIEKGMVSIVILTFNQLEFSQKCVQSIQRHTPEEHEIIFVDNGSTDGTKKWLRKQIRENPLYRLIENKVNLGFARGCNQGIKASRGEFLLLLNNDVLVTPKWLAGMLETLRQKPDVGIVGPMTNQISGIQKVEKVGYTSLEGLDEYAREFKERNRYRRVPIRRIVGFCMLFRRELVDQIGILDETFGTGNYEDDDFCLRAELAGFRNVIAGDVFIHHFGSRTFIANGIDYRDAMTGNQNIFSQKWNHSDPQTPEEKKYLALRAREAAQRDFDSDQFKKAVDRLLAVMKLGTEGQEGQLALAEILLEGKQYEKAVEVLMTLPASGMDDRKSALLGYCQEGMSRVEEAEQLASQALSLNPKNASALNLKGILAYRRQKVDEAAGYFQKAIVADGGYGEPYVNLGVIRWEASRKEEALDLFERGFILAPTAAENAQLYHSAIVEKREFLRAEHVFREAKALHPFHKRIQFLLIDLLLRQKKYDRAIEEIAEAMIHFGIDEGMLQAAIQIRKEIGPQEKFIHGPETGISLCMIVRNEETYLPKCLQSAKPLVDEMIVVDTGSSDRTKDIAIAFGAKVFDFVWEDDFSAPRNFSLSKAKGDWILVLDADEVISPQDYRPLLALTRKGSRKVAYSMTTRNYTNNLDIINWTANNGNYGEEAGSGWFPSEKVRIFPRNHKIQFENPVHEFVEPSLERSHITINKCNIPVHHYAKLNADKEQKKGEEYFSLGKKKLQERGSDIHSLKELAVQADILGRHQEAIELWNQVITLWPNMTEAYINLTAIYMKLDKYQDASVYSRKALDLDPDCREAVLNHAIVEFTLGNIKNVITSLEGNYSKFAEYPIALSLLSVAHVIIGEKGKGLELIRKIKKMGFNDKEYYQNTAKKLIAMGRNQEGEMLFDIIEEMDFDAKQQDNSLPVAGFHNERKEEERFLESAN